MQFLDKYAFLAPIAIEAHTHIRQEFLDCRLYLEVRTEPEEEAIDKIERIDDRWWHEVKSRTQGKMFFNLD